MRSIAWSIRRAVVRAVNRALALAFVLLLVYAAIELGPEAYDLLVTECDTGLCCETCEFTPVSRIIDGDTFTLLGEPIRTFGYDSPEIGERCAQEATDRFKQLAGSRVRVEGGPRDRDRYDRILVYVYTEAGSSIDETMIREGLAVAWTADGQHVDVLKAVEARAKDRGAGCLWGGR